MAAYQQGGRKLADIRQKDLEKMLKRVYSQFKMFGSVTDFKPRISCAPLLISMSVKYIVDVLIKALERV